MLLQVITPSLPPPGAHLRRAARGDPDQDRRRAGGGDLQGGRLHHPTGGQTAEVFPTTRDEGAACHVLGLLQGFVYLGLSVPISTT